MFAGHVGAGLAIARLERRVTVAAFVFAALLLDVVLWLAILAGGEAVVIPTDFSSTHQAQFVFPYSHGLSAALGWSLSAGMLSLAAGRALGHGRGRVATLIGVAVFSHWLLDALVHRPELPLLDEASTKVGAGLWAQMPLALGIEAIIAAGGLWLFLAGAGLSRARGVALGALALCILAATAFGMTRAPAPPSTTAMAVSSLLTIAVVTALFHWIGRPAVPPARVAAG